MVEEKEVERKEEEIEAVGTDSSDDSLEDVNEEEGEEQEEQEEEEEEEEEESHFESRSILSSDYFALFLVINSLGTLDRGGDKELIADLLEVESKAAEAQEALEEESLVKVEADVRKELAQSLSGDEAVTEEIDNIEGRVGSGSLTGLRPRVAHLLEQLDGAGMSSPVSISGIESKLLLFAALKHGKKRLTGAGGMAKSWRRVPVVIFGGSFFRQQSTGSVYLASTPQQAAELGLKFPGVDEDAIQGLDGSMAHEDGTAKNDIGDRETINIMPELSGFVDGEKTKSNNDASASMDLDESRGVKHSSECNERPSDDNKCTITIESDDEAPVAVIRSPRMDEATKSESQIASSSDSDSDDSDSDVGVNGSTKRRRKKKIRRIIDDAELGEETKKKIAIEKERQERLKSLEARFSTQSVMMSSAVSNRSSFDGTGVEVLGDISSGYIVNVVREEGEEAVRIPPSISMKLKLHQIAGIRFMWENIIQSVRKVRSGDKGLGCILAHTMGLGKTFQVIAFLYTAMRSVDLGLKTALIVTPVSVLHNWRHEFMKWRPSELKPLRIFMLEDVPREKRVELLMKWRIKGGVFLIGYTAFRNLSLGKYVKDRYMAKAISHALQDGPDILVCDEAHIIKNTRADTTQALKQVKCQRRIALTGSPLQNNLMEYYCMVDFVREGFLGSSHEFRNRFQNPIENGQHTNSTAEDVKIMNQRSHILYEQLKGFVQRMDMNVVKKDLPPKTVFVISVKLSPLQRKLYKRFLDVHGFTKDKVSGEKIIKRSFFAGYQALAQIWNHPGILQLRKENKDSVKFEDVEEDSSSDENVDYNMISGEKLGNPHRKSDNGFLREDWWRDLLMENNYKDADQGGKMVLLLDILTMCSSMGDKALVFSQSILTLDLIEFYLSKFPRPRKNGKCWRKGKDWYRLDGRTESSERQRLVERFNDPLNRRVKCCLISTRAGSLGINLHAANRVIIVDGSWNPTYDLQAIYRVWRYGQTKPVFAYRLLAHATMEEKIYKRQVTKEGLAARVVDRQQVHRTMSKEEILHLFDFWDDENADIMPELGQDSDPNTTCRVGNSLKQKLPLPHGSSSSDKLIETLISRHHPRWISNYHEHETLLQENEDEKLSKEEQDLAWEVYRKTLEWEEVRRVFPDANLFEQQQKISVEESALSQQQRPVAEPVVEQKPELSTVKAPKQDHALERARQRHRYTYRLRDCTNLSHIMTLKSQRVKMGGSAICGECAQLVRWEDVKPDPRF
ncbi:protein CHROMATIN REMODELING 20 [Sesamum alatum]|uniref:Protein CHROMATIN REMODELING 20 n=1 Tax=Sesamum alatum TaxID=300844 RepID=A0AAE1YNQ2_9LAMI|nr:protein CHROMATIN REMODELING 20 [Sesamum alatum]